MDAFDFDRAETIFTHFSDLEPARGSVFATANALTPGAGFDPATIDTHVGEHFDHEKGDIAVANIVASQLPNVAHADDSSVFHVHPRTLVQRANRDSHASTSDSA